MRYLNFLAKIEFYRVADFYTYLNLFCIDSKIISIGRLFLGHKL